MCPGQERQQNIAPDTVQPVPQNQRQTWRYQQHFGANNAPKNLHRARYFHRCRRYSPTGRR